ncbi:Ribonuclease H superfamily [Sesbania bispinosa]|nr:Ribonuclease H superfamily [Sesbania bispinosa]
MVMIKDVAGTTHAGIEVDHAAEAHAGVTPGQTGRPVIDRCPPRTELLRTLPEYLNVVSNNSKKRHLKEILATSSSSRPTMTFTDDDFGPVVPGHNDPLLVIAYIANHEVWCIFIDPGSSADIMFEKTFHKLVVSQIKGDYKVKEPLLIKYLAKVRELMAVFRHVEVCHVPMKRGMPRPTSFPSWQVLVLSAIIAPSYRKRFLTPPSSWQLKMTTTGSPRYRDTLNSTSSLQTLVQPEKSRDTRKGIACTEGNYIEIS